MNILGIFGQKFNGSRDITWHSSNQKVQEELRILRKDPFLASQESLVNHAFKNFSKHPEFTEHVQLQVIEAAYGDIDTEGNFQLRDFSLHELSIPELVLLYKILDTYQKEPTEVGRKIVLIHLSLIEKRVRMLAGSFREKIEAAVQEENDESARTLQLKALNLPGTEKNSMEGSNFERSSEDWLIRVFQYLTPEEQGIAKRVCKYWNIVMNGTYFASKCQKRFQEEGVVKSGFFSSSRITNLFAFDLPVQTKMGIAYGLYTKALQRLSIPRSEGHPQVLLTKDIKDQDEKFRASVFVQFVLSLPEGVVPLASIELLRGAPDLTTLINRASDVRRTLGTLPSVRTLQALCLSKSETQQNVTLLPQAIKFFTSLRVLVIEGNGLPALPKEISSLVNLQVLKLARNHIPSLPEGFRSLKNLRVLDLSENQMDSLSDGITELEGLENLYLGGNKLSSLPKEFEKLGRLKVIDLSDNEFPEIPRCLALFENLVRLDLRNNRFQTSKQELESSFPNFSKVQSLTY